jgi:antitoxin (DNA-binding transcriptional repressor) of toxin-antitoxin stability system
MTLHSSEGEVGVRELHDRLSEYLEKVEHGADLIVTRRGKRIARISHLDAPRPFEDLERRGLVRLPTKPRKPRTPRVKSMGSVSDLVSEQRR